MQYSQKKYLFSLFFSLKIRLNGVFLSAVYIILDKLKKYKWNFFVCSASNKVIMQEMNKIRMIDKG